MSSPEHRTPNTEYPEQSDMLDITKRMRERFGEQLKPSIVCRTQAGEDRAED